MAIPKLRNYLRTYRKRSGLSQSEVAYLVKLYDSAALSNLERFSREPSLRTAIACEKAFGVPASRLFPAIYASTGRETTRRIRKLRYLLMAAEGTRRRLHRLRQKIQWLGHRLGEFIPNFAIP